jgi:thiol:disulfide interchange protein DsbA
LKTLKMTSFISKIVCRAVIMTASALFVCAAFAQAPKEVVPIDPPQPVANDGTVEVIEFFGYGCIHCANLEPALEAWVAKLPADVKFKRAPAGFSQAGIDDVPIYYTLEAMGEIQRLHKKIFEAIFNDRVTLGHKPTLLKWLEKQGVDPKKYESVENSFSVASKIKRGRELAGLYKVNATPMIAVNGRFLAQQIGGANNFLATIDRLINDARRSNAPANPPPKASAPAAKPAATPAATPATKPAAPTATK